MRAPPPRRPLPWPDPPLGDDVVILRAFTASDVGQLYAACQDPAIQHFIHVPSPYHHHDAVAYVQRAEREWRSGERAAFAIADRDDPSVVLGAVNLAVTGSCGTAAYWVVSAVRGLGIATRALRLVREWGESTLGLGVLLLEIDPTNEVSRSVAQDAGFHLAGHLELAGVEAEAAHLLYAHLAGGEPGTRSSEIDLHDAW